MVLGIESGIGKPGQVEKTVRLVRGHVSIAAALP
jgi:hypothetical protein